MGRGPKASSLAVGIFAAAASGQPFVNWESPHVHPIDITPNRAIVVAVNTPDDRLEVFAAHPDGSLATLGAISVGLDPVSVRVRSDTQAWVVNHISDSISIVDLPTHRVIATLATGDEPADIVFAGNPNLGIPERAFVTISQRSEVWVFDPSHLSAPPQIIPIAGASPRGLAVSADGATVFAAVFASGNATTILGGGGTLPTNYPPNAVNNGAGSYAGVNPPPNDGADFSPPISAAHPPRVGLIVRRDAQGAWVDDNAGDWTALVSGANASASGRAPGWNLTDHDVAVIDAGTHGVTYIDSLMNLCMAIAVNPDSGEVTVVGTDSTNEVRYEPNLTGRFLRVELAQISPGSPPWITDLNPHLAYTPGPAFTPIPQAQRDRSIGDPRGAAWNSAGTKCYITGMGSDNLIVVDTSGARAGLTDTIGVGSGPTGITLNESAGVAYVLNKFDASVSTINLASEAQIATAPFYDPSPSSIRSGRPHLFNTRATSGLGQLSCASCHIDARTDRLAWDLGQPSGAIKPFNQNCLDGDCIEWHPMKGPMLTQTLQDIIGKEGFHWRGDREGLESFNPAYQSLLGDDTSLSPAEMHELKDYLATITFPPNPYRNLDNSLPTDVPLPGHFTTGRFGAPGLPLPDGNAQAGLTAYRTGRLFGGTSCVTCHTLPTGLGPTGSFQTGTFQPFPPGPDGELHLGIVSLLPSTNVSMKVPQLRSLYTRVGFNTTQDSNTAGFGYLHDGSVDSIERFISQPGVRVASNQQVADLVAFLVSFSGSDLPAGSNANPFEPQGVASKDTHAAVGKQATITDGSAIPPAQDALLSQMLALADAHAVGLVVKGVQGGITRGYTYVSAGTFQSDRAAESVSASALRTGAHPGAELTWTVVPGGAQVRIGIDRDLDSFLDRDEIDAGSDPADPNSVPPPHCAADINTDGRTNIADFNILAGHFAQSVAPHTNGDLTGDGLVNVADFNILAGDFGCGS